MGYEILHEGTPLPWEEWADLCRSEEWTSDDNSVLSLTPSLQSTRCVFAVSKEGGFVGCVVWNEYDNIAWIGFYLVHPSFRGTGVGSVVWKTAIERIPAHYTIGLRAVAEMADKYKTRETKVEGPRLFKYDFPCQQMREIFKALADRNADIKTISNSDERQMKALADFDTSVTGRNRSEFLNKFFSCPLTHGVIVEDHDGGIAGYAAVTSTSFVERNLFKLAPVYAPHLATAASLILPLITFCEEISPSSHLLLHLLRGTAGEQIEGILTQPGMPPAEASPRRTLFSREYPNPMDASRCFVPHNNSGHYDG